MRSDFGAMRLGALAVAGAASLLGAQAPGRSYTGFTPGACALVPRMVDHFATRELRDTSAYSPAKDTTSRIAADSVRYCASAYGSSVDDWELLNQARVQLTIGADADARANAEKYLAKLAGSPAEKQAWALYLIVRDDLRVRPARIGAAQNALARIGKLGKGGIAASILGHLALAQAQRVKWDDAEAAAEASKSLALWQTLGPELKTHLLSVMPEAFQLKAEIQLRTNGPDAARAVIDTALATVPASAFYLRRQIEASARLYATTGRKFAPIDATFWFNGDGGAVSRPEAGKVTIISQLDHSCGGFCRPRYDALRRFSKRFAARGLDLISVTKTMGFYEDTAGVTAADEAKYDSSYFLGRKAIPGQLAVYETKFRWLADGRRRDDPTPQEMNYPYATFIIVDRKGIVRYVSTGFDPILEEPLAKFIERLLADAGAAGTP